MMHQIFVHWTDRANQEDYQHQRKCEQRIEQERKTKRYRRVWFYFFEQEIRQDIKDETSSQVSENLSDRLLDAEYTALMARNAFVLENKTYTAWDYFTIDINDYLFGQGVFFEKDYETADKLLVDMFVAEQKFHKITLSDFMLEARRARADIVCVQQLENKQYDFQGLMKRVGDYVGTFARLPRFLQYYGERSSHSIAQALDTPKQCAEILEPRYELYMSYVDPKDIASYGSLDIEKTPYVNVFSRVGLWRSRQARYSKIGLSVAIVVLSVSVGGRSLFVLPVLWGLLAVARSASQYLAILQERLLLWYHSFDEQLWHHSLLHSTMIDPNTKGSKSVQAEKTLSQWFDVVVFAGESLDAWGAKSFAHDLYVYLMSFGGDNEDNTKIMNILALYRRSQDHHLPLFVVEETKHAEQILYRLSLLIESVESVIHGHDDLYQEYYTSYDKLIEKKKQDFRSWTMRHSIGDGALVALSSATLGRLGLYLRNRDVGTSTALAATPAAVEVASHSGELLRENDDIMTSLGETMTSEQTTAFLTKIANNPSDTLRDTLVDMFGFDKGNVITNDLMDVWWRISDNQTTSNLFDQALSSGLPVSPHEPGRYELTDFLHRTYDYESLSHYSNLIDQPWLSETLQQLQLGEMNIEDFAHLSLEQREIVTQAMFWKLDTSSLQDVFANTGKMLDVQGEQMHATNGDSLLSFGNFLERVSRYDSSVSGIHEGLSFISKKLEKWFAGSLDADIEVGETVFSDDVVSGLTDKQDSSSVKGLTAPTMQSSKRYPSS